MGIPLSRSMMASRRGERSGTGAKCYVMLPGMKQRMLNP
jgi:hypothetical protein